MLKFQIDQYDMILSTEKHLDDNPTLIASNALLSLSKNLLSSKITTVAQQIALQLVNPAELSVEKNTTRKLLEEQTIVLGSACCNYASANTNPELYNRCNYTKTDLTRYRDIELAEICTNLHADVQTHSSALIRHGVTTDMADAYEIQTNNFSRLMKNPTAAIAKRTTATRKIATMLPEILEILSTRLDKEIILMNKTEGEFVKTYNNIRGISDSPTSTLSITTTVLDAVTNQPITHVDLEIVGENIYRKTSSRGYNTVLNLLAGSHTLKVSHPNYETQTLMFSVVDGETTELVIQMNNALVPA